ncbi:MAG: hypothetical protein IPO50_10625 [Sphingomonadales bacterium]|nr:hypothetical protein [Sphingomonadales bacterium]
MASSWTPAPPFEDRSSPIFIVGFAPGTTLLDTMLMADPRVRVLEEPFLAEAEAERRRRGSGNGNRGSGPGQREGYFRRAAAICG